MSIILEFARGWCIGVGAAWTTHHVATSLRRRLLDVRPSRPTIAGDPDWTPWRTWTDWRNAWRFRQISYRFDRSLWFAAGVWRTWRLERARNAQTLADLWRDAESGRRNWHMHEHDGKLVAIDMDAAKLTIGKPEFTAEPDTDAYRWRAELRYRFDLQRDDAWRVTGISV